MPKPNRPPVSGRSIQTGNNEGAGKQNVSHYQQPQSHTDDRNPMAPAMDACSNHLDLATWVCHGCPMQGRATESTFSSPSVTSPGPFGGRKMEPAPHLTTHRVVPLRNAFAWRRPPKRCRSVDYKMALARGSGRPNAKRLALDPRPTSFRRVGQWRRGCPALRGLVPIYLMDTGTVSAQQ